jgi:pyrroline-5-carboxylate reductase
MTPQTIAFIGGGNMASSLIGGLVADGYDPQTLNVSEPDQAKRDALAERFGVSTFADSLDALRGAATAVLCVKPQMAHRVCRDIAPAIGPPFGRAAPLVISIMAGVTEASIQGWLGHPAAVVRTMPNTPAMIQSGAIAMHASNEVGTEQRNRAETIMRACGLARWVAEEALIDVATAVSGSGPAYFFRLMEAMEQAGIELGLDPEDARLLTIQTALGAARMAMESDDPPQTLRERVTSPGGTTERALTVLDEGGFVPLVERAVGAARRRAAEISAILAEEP